jgi:hypothetical protein
MRYFSQFGAYFKTLSDPAITGKANPLCLSPVFVLPGFRSVTLWNYGSAALRFKSIVV